MPASNSNFPFPPPPFGHKSRAENLWNKLHAALVLQTMACYNYIHGNTGGGAEQLKDCATATRFSALCHETNQEGKRYENTFSYACARKLRIRPLFNKELEIIHSISVELADEFVAYDEVFNGLSDLIKYTNFSEDGVHPTHRGSRLIADTAIKAIRKHLL